MNLTRTTFDILADAVASKLTPDIYKAFHNETATIKRQIVQEICDERGFDFPLIMITEFVIAMALTANHSFVPIDPKAKPPNDINAIAKELGVELARVQYAWTKSKPPKLYPDLIMQWPEEYAAIGAMAAKIPFAAIGDHQWYRNAVHEGLGYCGYLEYLLGGQIPTSDPTMQLFIMGIHTMLKALHAEWFDDEGTSRTKLEKGVSGASTEMLAFTSDLEDRLRRKKVAQESAAKRREAAIAEKAQARESAFNLIKFADHWQETINSMSLLPFEKVRSIITSPEVGPDTAGGKTWLSKFDLQAFATVYPITNALELEFAEQFILSHLNKRLPTWFKTTQDGTLKIRRAPLKVRKPGLDRPTRSLHKRLVGLIEKHGEEKVANALLTITGQLVTWDDITASASPGSMGGKA